MTRTGALPVSPERSRARVRRARLVVGRAARLVAVALAVTAMPIAVGGAASAQGTPAAAPPNRSGGATPAADGAVPARPAAVLRRMLEAARRLEVVGTTRERIALPGVLPAPHHDRFALPVAVTPKLVAAAFRLGLGAPTSVAGRRVEVLELHGIDPLTPDWTFWVDAATGVRLAYRLVDSAGGLVAEGRYTAVRAVRERATPRALPSPAEQSRVLGLERTLGAANVPRGYVPVGVTRTEIGAAKLPALRITFWDGLDAMVLLVYRSRAGAPRGGTEHLASRAAGRFTLTAVGPAPASALAVWLDRLAAGPLARARSLPSFQGGGAP